MKKVIDLKPEYEKAFKDFWKTIPGETWFSASKKFYALMPHCFTGRNEEYMKKTLYYAEIYFNGHFSPWSVYRTGFKPDIPRMDSEHLYASLEDLEDAISRARDECVEGTIKHIRRESVEVYTCRNCGMEFGHDEIRKSGECDPCYRAVAMGSDQ